MRPPHLKVVVVRRCLGGEAVQEERRMTAASLSSPDLFAEDGAGPVVVEVVRH